MTALATAQGPGLRQATQATYAAFIGSGFAFASWASRIPQVKGHLHLSSAQLGLVLLSIASGSVIALPLSGSFVSRYGSRRTVASMAWLLALGLATVAVGLEVGVVLVAVGLFVLGFANGAWDVAMNVQGALVERELGKAIMARFHAGFSLGTVAGALLGAAMVALDVPVTAHLLGVAAVVGLGVPAGVRHFIPDHAEETAGAAPRARAMTAWREPRTLLVGLFVLAFAFGEGTGNDWISVALISGYHTSAALGTLGFAVFLVAMTAGRWVGPSLLDRYGRVPVIRVLAAAGAVGLALFVFAGATPAAFVGLLLWGCGVSLGFPVGMSAAADDASVAAARVSVVASIGYCAFLGGPPLIGFLGQQFSVLHAVTAVGILLALATVIAGAVRPLRPE